MLELQDVELLLKLGFHLCYKHLIRFLDYQVINRVSLFVICGRNTCMTVFTMIRWDLQTRVVALRAAQF